MAGASGVFLILWVKCHVILTLFLNSVLNINGEIKF
jgi:hypothetical protein